MREGEREEDRRGEWPIPAESGGGEKGGKGRSVTWLFARLPRVTTIRLKSEDRGGGGGGEGWLSTRACVIRGGGGRKIFRVCGNE